MRSDSCLYRQEDTQNTIFPIVNRKSLNRPVLPMNQADSCLVLAMRLLFLCLLRLEHHLADGTQNGNT